MNVPGEVVKTVGSALNWKSILTAVVLSMVVIIVLWWIMQPKISLTDQNGNTITGKFSADWRKKV